MSGGIEEMNKKNKEKELVNERSGYMRFEFSYVHNNKICQRSSVEIDEYSDIYDVINAVSGVLISGGYAQKSVIDGFSSYCKEMEYLNEKTNKKKS